MADARGDDTELAAPRAVEGFERAASEDEFTVPRIDLSRMSESERRVQRWKDCFWELEHVLAGWFGLDDSRYEFEMALRQEEDARRASEMTSARRAEDAAASAAEGGGSTNPFAGEA